MDLNVPSVLTAAVPAGKIFSFKSMAIDGAGSINIKLSSFSSSRQIRYDFLNFKATSYNFLGGALGGITASGFQRIKSSKYDFAIKPMTTYQSNIYGGLTNYCTGAVSTLPAFFNE
jgi:hypothetical protein